MARFRYYHDTAQTALLFDPKADPDVSIYYEPNERRHYATRKSEQRWTGTRWEGPRYRLRVIDYKPNPSRHECNARCQSATGFQCECKCNGRNHGRWSSGAATSTTRPTPSQCEALL